MGKYLTKAGTLLVAVFSCFITFAQTSVTITGHIQNSQTKERIPAVSVSLKGSGAGTTTDDKGNFKLTTTRQPPFVLVFTSVGFESKEVTVTGTSEINVDLTPGSILGTEVVVSASRVQESILASPVSIEKLNATAIRQIAAPTFYDALPSLKGVETSVQSLTFRGVTTRGFNANGNTRFNQFIDGMDNQAPGLNFSVANIVGPSDLDVATVELLPGASSALYGAGGMNGTLLVTSKSPFEYQGLSVKLQGGVNHVGKKQQSSLGFIPDLSARYAKAFGKFAFKLSVSWLQADDWQANDSTNFNRLMLKTKPGFNHTADPGYDGVNVYGDEINTTFGPTGGALNGVTVSRTGYKEADLVDYRTKNFKGTAAIHYRLTDNTEAILQGNYGSGTTVYTGSDRYSLRNFNIGQYKLEVRGKRFYVRVYTTQERSGEAYNATALGTLLNEAYNPSAKYDNAGNVIGGWFAEYAFVYNTARAGGASDAQAHASARAYADRDRLQPGSAPFNTTKNTITSNYIGFGAGRNGAKFNDKTNLYQYEGMYDFTDHIKVLELQVGGSFRHYSLGSNGTIFADSAGRIGTDEIGGFLQVGKKLVNDRIHLIGSIRYDKNENFDGRATPRIAAVFTVAPQHNIRLSYQTGYRNPTNQDQWIDLPIRANTRLIGGLPAIINDKYHLNTNKGYTQESLAKYQTTGNPADLQQYTFGKFKPETVDAYEIGYKGLIANRLLIDAYYYYDRYKDFLSYLVLIQPGSAGLANPNIFATYVNNPNKVTTQGAALGLDYLMDNWAVSGNFSYNDITKDEGLANSFNSPKYRYNLGLSNRNVYKNIGFNVTYRWQDAFLWNSSFATGNVAAFGTVDAQVSYKLPAVKTIIKLGGSNITNHYYQTSFGNPKVGAVYYLSLTFDEMIK
ncbi:TonB-dependent receptor [Flavitalea sp. BT771]|uniref:TonB-dependent receptor n=1 Tax=Flavitalea sp. BT771 TaxID=3063329 RepID=UPI0026E2F60D|nr:TonB-dependent receptor [Flavitalea sp. BT771]MDO6430098.1 TonB-dependent receptor [Flavitalea sp. BT771]MDV6219763.1 TonB-dependent receptor [Flavitalea sp. BT771]